MTRKINWRYLVVAKLFFCCLESAAQEAISNIELYYRCYAQLTQQRPDASSSMSMAVASGALSPIAACEQVLRSAQVGAGGTIADTNDAVAKNVLRTFHNLHASWFDVKKLSLLTAVQQLRGQMVMYESSQAALYFTKALLDPNTAFQTVFTSYDNLQAIRTEMTPAIDADSHYLFTPLKLYAPQGDLLGVSVQNSLTMNYDFSGSSYSVNKSIHAGGGAIGANVYLLQTVKTNMGFKPDGGIKMPRRWARSAFRDILCRELPLVRESDALAHVVSGSSISFRQSKSCTVCHVSMDRFSSVIRHMEYNQINFGARGLDYISFSTPSLSMESQWPTEPDNDYSRRPPTGTLFFRNYLGELIDLPVMDAADLGAKLAQQDDVYICAAKRYYAYLTGVDVRLYDTKDPKEREMTWLEKRHWEEVVRLGKNLKQHNDPLQTILEILNSPHYQKSDFGKLSILEGATE